MKKKLVLALCSLVVAALAIGGATYALFTDSASNTEKTFMAGKLAIDSNRSGVETVPGPMFYTTPEEGEAYSDGRDGLKPTGLWAPGDVHIRTLSVINDGSLNAVIDGVKAEVDSDATNMAADLNVKIYKVLPLDPEEFGIDPGDLYLDLPGDNSLPDNILELLAVRLHNRLMQGLDRLGIEQLVQWGIEQNLDMEPIWQGRLSELVGENYHSLGENSIGIAASDGFLTERGCLLAFAVELDKEDAGNEQQGAKSIFGFTVKASNAVSE